MYQLENLFKLTAKEYFMKKVFLVQRTDPIDWDEYDSCVIIADNEEEVHKMIDGGDTSNFNQSDNNYWDTGKEYRKVTEINLNETKSYLLCSSFNAG